MADLGGDGFQEFDVGMKAFKGKKSQSLVA